MSVVRLAPHFLARRVQRGAVGHDDVVAAVCGGIVDGFVLAHEDDGDAGGEAAERGGGDVGLGGEGWMWC